MSLPIVGAAASVAFLNAASQLTDPSLTPMQSAQIQQVVAELQTGTITQVEARAQIDAILSVQQAQAATGTTTTTAAQNTYAQADQSPGNGLERAFYEIPLPQESLPTSLLSAYTPKGTPAAHGSAAPQVVFSA